MDKKTTLISADTTPPRHNNGSLLVLATIASYMGYDLMEGSVQKLYEHALIHSEAIYNYVTDLPEAVREPLQHQGSDFMGAYFYTSLLGLPLAIPVLVINKFAPQTKAAKFLQLNFSSVRDIVGFSYMTYHEVDQAITDNTTIDLKDITAYAAGILTFGYGHKIARGLYEASKDICIGTKQLLFPTPQEKLEKQLRL